MDTALDQGRAGTQFGTAAELGVDLKTDKQFLMRFEDLFGAGGIPEGAQILSATLTLQTTSKGDGATIHRMLQAWSESSTWNSLVGGEVFARELKWLSAAFA